MGGGRDGRRLEGSKPRTDVQGMVGMDLGGGGADGREIERDAGAREQQVPGAC